MARVPEAQNAVLDLARQIPMSENSRVHDDIADIALALPPSLAAKLAPQICASIPVSVKLLLGEKVKDLIVHLATGAQEAVATQLTASALALAPNPRVGKGEEESILSPEPQSYFGNWYYRRIVAAAVPELVKCSGIEAVRLFCSLLNDAIRLPRKREAEGDEDFLYIKHPAIEHGKHPDDIPSLLLCALRDAAEVLITADPTQFSAVIALFQQQKWVSFRRLELHIARVFPELGQALAEQTFQQPEILSRASTRHEAVLLLKATFPNLTAETKQQILSWMDAGPSEESVRKWLEFIGGEVTDDKIHNLVNRGRLDHFSILEGQLPEAYQTRYEDLKVQLGAPNPPDRVSYPRFGAISAQSPKTTEELAELSVDDLVGLLRSWVPEHDVFGPTAEGLGGAFASVVAKRPTDFAAAATKMEGLDPTYIRALFGSLTAALKQGEPWDWGPVLELARWVVAQGREIPGRKGGLMDADPDWGWSRTAIIDLFTTGFEGGPDRLPPEYRTSVWEVLQPLTDDPYPGIEDERGEKFDPSFLSINSTRGRALDAVIDYAWWLRRCTDQARKAQWQAPIDFPSMPEVRDVLNAHLEIEREPTLTIRSVYGRQLTSLAGLDWNWLRTHVEAMLPPGQDDQPRFSAAWESFVAFNEPNTVLLEVLLPAYRRAVGQIGQLQGMMRHPVSPEDRLAQHLMIYYWLGSIDFGSGDGLIDGFFASASDALRGHAMWFVGTSVSHWDEVAPAEVLGRLRRLVERRLDLAIQADPPDLFVKELANFGWWFTSEKFDERWSLETFLSILRLTKKTEGEMDVVKLLSERCPKYPVECVTCLRLMIEGDRERWLVGVETDVIEILRRALNSHNPDAALSARRLAEELIARGHFAFRTLLACST